MILFQGGDDVHWCRWTVKHVTGTGSSPARGAIGDNPENQKFVLSSPDPDSSSPGLVTYEVAF